MAHVRPGLGEQVMRVLTAVACAWAVGSVAFGNAAVAAPLPDAAERFGARVSAASPALSPDGSRLGYLAPTAGQGEALVVLPLAGGAPVVATRADGKPQRLSWCDWAANDRLVCEIWAIVGQGRPEFTATRLVALDPAGGRMVPLGQRGGADQLAGRQFDGNVLAWGSDDGRILMERVKIGEVQSGRTSDTASGLAVDLVNTRTGAAQPVERQRPDAWTYLAEPNGEVRVMIMNPQDTVSGQMRDETRALFRLRGSRDWRPLDVPGQTTKGRDALRPIAIDPATDSVFAWIKKRGRDALVRVSLDGQARMTEVASDPNADVDSLLRFGRLGRVVGVDVVTDRRRSQWFDPEFKRLAESLGKAIPHLPLIEFVGASRDEKRILIFAHADDDPGRWYLFDRDAKKLSEIMLARPKLEGVPLAKVTPVTYPAADGTMIPGYLTLPPGGPAKGLRAIVMPHGGPSARDEWGFDWLAQYFAHLGFAVLQPNFRGSTGYGDDWFGDNGFKNWATAIADINAGGRWLERSGVAAPGKLAIVGWSYGGYAALQSQVVDPGLFKAVVAIAPVTDFQRLIEEKRGFTNFALAREYVSGGAGAAALAQGSPVNFPDRFRAPVLMFHGDRDLNVRVGQAQAMDAALRKAGKPSRLVVYEGLDHQLDDSAARAGMLREAGAFIDQALR